jgi:hypothetical protein
MLTPERIKQFDEITGLKSPENPAARSRAEELRAIARGEEVAPREVMPEERMTFGERMERAGERAERIVKPGLEITKGIAKGVGTTIFGAGKLFEKITEPITRKAAEVALAPFGRAEEVERVPPIFPEEKPEILEPVGALQKIGYTAEQLGEFFVPLGGGGKALMAAEKLAPKIAIRELPQLAKFGIKAVGEGGEFALKVATQTAGDISDTSKAFILGVAANPILKVAEVGARPLTKILPERIMSRIFRTAEDDLRLAYKTVAEGKTLNPTLAREVLDRGLRGSSRNMAAYSFKKLNDLERQVQKVVKDPKKIISIKNKVAYENFLKDVNETFKRGFFPKRAKEASQMLDELAKAKPNEMTMGTALRLRRFIDGMRSTSSFRLDPKLAPRQDEFKEAANILRKKIGDAGLRNLMNEERVFIEAIDAIVADAAKRQNRNIIGLVDILAGGGGIAAGSIVGGVSAAAAIRGFQQPFTLTHLAGFLDRAGKLELGKIIKPAVIGIEKEITK